MLLEKFDTIKMLLKNSGVGSHARAAPAHANPHHILIRLHQPMRKSEQQGIKKGPDEQLT